MKTQAVLALSLSGVLLATSVVIFNKRPDLFHSRPVAKTSLATSPMPADLSQVLDDLAKLPPTSSFGRQIVTAVHSVRAAPLVSDDWVRLGDALTLRSRATFDTALYRKIERVYLYAHQLDSTNASSLVGLAWAAGAAHRFEDSVAWATLALKGDPNLSAAYGILGDAAVELGKHDDAARNYQKMLDLRPDLGAYSRAAHLMYLEGNVPRAMSLIRKAIDAAGGDVEQAAWSVAELSMMQCREGAALIAVKMVDDWLKKSPNNITLLNASGQAHMAANQDEAAIAALEHAAGLMPQHSTLAALYDLYFAAGRTQDADKISSRIEELHRQYQREQIQGSEGQLARFYADRGVKLDEAVRLAEAEYSHHRGAIPADTLAWAYYKVGRVADAKKLVPEILRRRVPDPAMLYHVGMLEAAMGDTTDARRHLYSAVSREPRFNPVHAPLAYAALGK